MMIFKSGIETHSGNCNPIDSFLPGVLQLTRRPDGHVSAWEQHLQLFGLLPHVNQIQKDAFKGWCAKLDLSTGANKRLELEQTVSERSWAVSFFCLVIDSFALVTDKNSNTFANSFKTPKNHSGSFRFFG